MYFLEYEYFSRFVWIDDDNFAYMRNIGKQSCPILRKFAIIVENWADKKNQAIRG